MQDGQFEAKRRILEQERDAWDEDEIYSDEEPDSFSYEEELFYPRYLYQTAGTIGSFSDLMANLRLRSFQFNGKGIRNHTIEDILSDEARREDNEMWDSFGFDVNRAEQFPHEAEEQIAFRSARIYVGFINEERLSRKMLGMRTDRQSRHRGSSISYIKRKTRRNERRMGRKVIEEQIKK